MAGPIDLHIHSTFSDGLLSPSEIIAKAKELGINVLALTDHDTTNGLPEIIAHKNGTNLTIVPGVELSTHHELASIHLLGYGFDYRAPALQDKLKKIQLAREHRNIAIIAKLQDLGFDISYAEIKAISKGQIGRPHIASLLVKKWIVSNEAEAFIRFLKKGSKAYVERALLPVEEAIALIRDAGGIAIMAHPATIDPTCIFLPQLIEELHQVGLQGLEVYHPAHNAKHIKLLNGLCEKLKMTATGGSDFHGRNRDHCELGNYSKKEAIKPDIWPKIKEIIKKSSPLYS